MVEVLVMKSSAGNEELRERILTEFKQVYRLASQGDYTENCTNVVMRLITASNQQLLRELEGQKLESLSWKLKYIQMKIKRQRALEYEALPSDKLTALLQQKYRIERQIEALRGANDEH